MLKAVQDKKNPNTACLEWPTKAEILCDINYENSRSFSLRKFDAFSALQKALWVPPPPPPPPLPPAPIPPALASPPSPRFQPCDYFLGSREGWAFRMGKDGLGYYKND